LGLKPVSADIRTGIYSRARISPGKSLARPETGRAFLAAPADFRRQRPPCPAAGRAQAFSTRTSLCRHSNQSLSATGNSAGKKFGETRDWAGIFGDLPDSGRQRPRYLASPAAKPPKVKDYSDDARKPELRRTAWWSWQDSNQHPNDYAWRWMSRFADTQRQCASPST
jgi:hypothetical protein